MKPNENPRQPVAYDEQGRPLYLHPFQTQTQQTLPTPHDEIEVVQVTRSTDPVAVTVSSEMARRHQDSRRKYPFLNLTNGEYVVREVKRHPAGLLFVFLTIGFSEILVAAVWWYILAHPGSHQPIIAPTDVGSVSVIAGALAVLFALIGWAAVAIFKGNKFFLTNESVIQEIQTSLVSRKEQTINLENIKDVSFEQNNLLQQIVGYGSIKLSTEGDEQEYDFTLVSKPENQVAIINNVVEAVKYGRPIDEAIQNIPH